jgi:multiple sugar transport system substrate-binding protein
MLKLRGITWDHPRGYQPLEACSAHYAQTFGVEVAWERRSLKDFGDVPVDRLARDFDLLIIDHPHVGLAARTRCLRPLDACLPPATLAALARVSAGPSHASYDYGGRQWALAIDAALQVAAFRPDRLPAGALPGSWDEVLTLAAHLRRQGQWMVMPLCPTDAICSFLTLCANLGAPVGPQWVDRAAARQALEWLAQLGAASHPEGFRWNPIAVLDRMAAQDDLVYCPLTFCYSNHCRAGFRAARLQFGPIPGVQGGLLGGAGIAVSAHTAQPEAACSFCAWVCSDGVQSGRYVQNGGQPGNATAWRDPRANAITQDFFRRVLPALERASVRPRHAGFVAFQEQAGRILQAFLINRQPVADCLAGLEALFWSCLDE